METIHFETTLESDRIIHLPDGVDVPSGVVEVIVRPAQSVSTVDAATSDNSWLLSLAKEAEQSVSGLPSDLAERHDFYAHGTQP